MKLSVVIVNYNVKYFLEQCLHSVYRAIREPDVEIFVVDNNSMDGSCAMIRQKFPGVRLIENHQNLGFSKANNQAIRLSQGEYVLLLNPDTVVEEDTFTKVVSFMDSHPEAGGLGVKMIDGKGIFLPESKRGLPTPMVAFYKIFGFSRLFPRSKTFSKYHLGYLSNNEIHEIDVLAGAFMLMRRQTLDKVGLLDEDYFMYGEDIDLSYRITLGGYKNYYYPGTTIIHYKGESTKKGSINYVRVFYNAMIIFARKHFTSKNARIFSFFIHLAIYFRAILAIISRFVKTGLLPFLDAAFIFAGFYFIAPFWENIKFRDGGHFPMEYFILAVPAYVCIWLLTVFLSGGYDKPVNILKMVRGMVVGTGIILMVYALLPEGLRFSRAMILIGSVWGIVAMLALRTLLHKVKISDFKFDFGQRNRMALIGSEKEAERVLGIIKQSVSQFEYLGLISPNENYNQDTFIGQINQMPEIIEVNRINELIFCATDMPAQQIIQEMLRLEGTGVSFKIAPPESVSIIGSNSIDTAGDLYTVDFNNLTKPHNLRKKRLFDVATSLLLFIGFPLYAGFIPRRMKWFKNLILVLLGVKSWVGFYYRPDINTLNLPTIKKGVLSWALVHSNANTPVSKIENLNLIYAKDYRLVNDLQVLWLGFRKIGET